MTRVVATRLLPGNGTGTRVTLAPPYAQLPLPTHGIAGNAPTTLTRL
jgi:hypothetical protein